MKNNNTSPAVTICGLTFDQYIEKIKGFHGHVAPGMVLGGFMVDLAYRNLPDGEFFDAVCETRACLPDAIQILTPCTVGNGWLKIVNLGRFALSFFEKPGLRYSSLAKILPSMSAVMRSSSTSGV